MVVERLVGLCGTIILAMPAKLRMPIICERGSETAGDKLRDVERETARIAG